MRWPLLAVHITAGIVGLLSGTVAMSLRKGSDRHRLAGDVFVVAMLIMGLCASILALMKHQTNNFFGGLLTFYLITTAWLSGRRRQETGIFDWLAFFMAVALGVSLISLGSLVARGLVEGQAGVPLGMYFFLGSIALSASAGDLRMLINRGISGKPRLVRHLWRMCFGLFIATGSFFLGQQQVFPDALRKQYLLFPLAILPLFLLIYWIVRVKFGRRTVEAYVSGQANARA